MVDIFNLGILKTRIQEGKIFQDAIFMSIVPSYLGDNELQINIFLL